MPDYRHAREPPHRVTHRNSAAVANDRGSPPGKVLRGRQVPGSFEKADRVLENVDHMIDLVAHAIEVKTGAASSRHAKSSHQWLVAMMAAAERKAVPVCESGEIMRMGCVHHKTDNAAALFHRPNHS